MEENRSKNFIEEIIDKDLASGKVNKVITRFPPEPNGYLHIGHAKSLCIQFGIKEEYNGETNLRFDDTNPLKENEEYVNAIKDDIEWMGFKWDRLCFGSNYFDQMYELAVKLIKKGLAYVCELSPDEIREYRGTLTEKGKNSPYRDRSVEENLKLFEEMKQGVHEDGSLVLRAKIDMASPNINMRDPIIYRILHQSHHNTKDKWCIYPLYDFAHPIQDAIEGITHSLCTLEFEDHRPLYDWVVNNCEFEKKPQQIEFARLDMTNTIMSKRYLKKLVDEGFTSGWDDPRMPTICGLRRRGYPAEAIKDFCEAAGVSKANSEVDSKMLDYFVRENLNKNALRRCAVLRPIKLVINNVPDDYEEEVELPDNPSDENTTNYKTMFTKEVYIEEDDFMLNPPPKYFRLQPGGVVRLKGAYIVRYTNCDTDKDGRVTTVYADIVENSRSGQDTSGVKCKGVIHWVSAKYAKKATFNLYESLLVDNGMEDFNDRLNPNSLESLEGYIEPELLNAKNEEKFQFIRVGYFVKDRYCKENENIFNRVVALKDGFKM